MQRKKTSPRGLTLLELLVSAVILALTLMGMANIFLGGRRWLLHARSRMTGGELGRVFLEPLQMQVRQDTWDTPANGLSLGERVCPDAHDPNCPSAGEATLHGIPYNARYNIGSVAGTDLRRVQVTIRWTEHQP